MPDKQQTTEQRILDAAMQIFSAVGFSGARVDEIAKRAGVNKAMIYYHVGDKEALYEQVLHNAIGHIADVIFQSVEAAQTPEEKLSAYIRSFAGFVENNPLMPPIMLREVASGGTNFPQLVANDFARLLGIIGAILEEGRSKGIFIEATPFIIHMMVVGATVLYRSSAPIRAKYAQHLESVGILDLNVSEKIVGEISTLILKAVKKTPENN